MRTNIPSFRLPAQRARRGGRPHPRLRRRDALRRTRSRASRRCSSEGFDAVFVGTGAPKGKDLDIPGRKEAAANIHIGIDWLTSVAFEHVEKIGKRVVVIGGGNTAMDCCRTALRLGAEKRDRHRALAAQGDEGLRLGDQGRRSTRASRSSTITRPKAFVLKDGKLAGVALREDDRDRRRREGPAEARSRPARRRTIECDDVLMAIGQENAFPWIERDIGLEFDEWDMPKVDRKTFMMSTRPGVFFGGDAAWGPENIIWAVAHGHQAAISIDAYCNGQALDRAAEARPHAGQPEDGHPRVVVHERLRRRGTAMAVPHADSRPVAANLKVEVELGFDDKLAAQGGRALPQLRCADGVHRARCASSATPAWTSARSTASTSPRTMPSRRCASSCACRPATRRRTSTSRTPLKTGRIMAKDEDVCLHCGLCAERCPTGAWDMQKFILRGSAGVAGLPDASQCLSALSATAGARGRRRPRCEHAGDGGPTAMTRHQA